MTLTVALIRAQQKQTHASDQDEGIEEPADRPGEGDQIAVVGDGTDKPVRSQGVEGVHRPGAEEGDADDGRGDVSGHPEVTEGQQHRQDGDAEGAPLEDCVAEGAREAAEHGFDDLVRWPSGGRIEGRLLRGEIDAAEIENKGQGADGQHRGDHPRWQYRADGRQ